MPEIFFMENGKVFLFYRLICFPKVTLVAKQSERNEIRPVSKCFNPLAQNNTEMMNH